MVFLTGSFGRSAEVSQDFRCCPCWQGAAFGDLHLRLKEQICCIVLAEDCQFLHVEFHQVLEIVTKFFF